MGIQKNFKKGFKKDINVEINFFFTRFLTRKIRGLWSYGIHSIAQIKNFRKQKIFFMFKIECVGPKIKDHSMIFKKMDI